MKKHSRKWALLIALLTALLLVLMWITITDVPPTTAQIETVGVRALNTQDKSSITTLSRWAKQGFPIAQRELGLVLSVSPNSYIEAHKWLEKAAAAGDVDAQFEMAEANYKARLGLQQNFVEAWKWYKSAAKQHNSKASFMLARMAKYGEGNPPDLAISVNWLKQSSAEGNAQAMFLLANAYTAGEGVEQDAIKAREWLERSAEGDYPVAIHELSLLLEGSAKITGSDPLLARHLRKEATDERTLRWNKYQ
ncbi:TPR repeat protein [Undibacterium sp. GrIS 1.2]|uniref:tetratricopeptide repeat protein n=1 Tax=Undibacterium sp. GrIS 1.2 TaxID=3143933 RepID=UPI0019885AE7|nr:sel1 repeat family protein [Glaciimonas sp.]